MSAVQEELVSAAINRAFALMDYNIHDDFHKQQEFLLQTVLDDKSLAKDVKTETIRKLNKEYDDDKVLYNLGTKRMCENCNQKCLATSYCELCVRNYLIKNFSNWTSGNDDIDNLIQKCQMKALTPERIIEWIPYDNLQNIKYLMKGGYSEIYIAEWINGRYEEWNSKEQQLERSGTRNVALKRLENVDNANHWFEEAKSHLTISVKWANIVRCYGLTQDPSNGNYMLVMNRMDIDLRNYLQQNHNQLTWKERIQITFDIIDALDGIHRENAIHRDLHSGNILYLQLTQRFDISDLGFCGPADKSLKSIYGNLPYIAPEVISRKEYTFASDIYSIGMLMWEISSGQLPFCDCKHDDELALNIINGIRPKAISGIPSEYKNLMEQCWDANPLKRPDTETLLDKIREMNLQYQRILNELTQPKANHNNFETNYTSRLFISKVHQFENMPEPRNATKEEQEAYYTKSYDFCIPDDIEDLDEDLKESSNQNKDNNKNLSEVFNELQINSKDDTKNDNQETTQQIKNQHHVEIDGGITQ